MSLDAAYTYQFSRMIETNNTRRRSNKPGHHVTGRGAVSRQKKITTQNKHSTTPLLTSLVLRRAEVVLGHASLVDGVRSRVTDTRHALTENKEERKNCRVKQSKEAPRKGEKSVREKGLRNTYLDVFLQCKGVESDMRK